MGKNLKNNRYMCVCMQAQSLYLSDPLQSNGL